MAPKDKYMKEKKKGASKKWKQKQRAPKDNISEQKNLKVKKYERKSKYLNGNLKIANRGHWRIKYLNGKLKVKKKKNIESVKISILKTEDNEQMAPKDKISEGKNLLARHLNRWLVEFNPSPLLYCHINHILMYAPNPPFLFLSSLSRT